MVKILLVDDHRMFRQSVGKILSMEETLVVVGEASNGLEVLELLESTKPDIILMDISMPVMDGIEATRRIMEKYSSIKIIALTSYCDEAYYFSMLEAGAKGFVLKSGSINDLLTAIDEVAAGGCWFSAALMQKVVTSLSIKSRNQEEPVLSEREKEIVGLICKSMTNEQIGNELHISLDTVKWHRSHIMAKTSCANTAGLVIYAIKHKLIEV
jgi:DNA-binding NarL/FixJ family response regulator